MYDMYDMCMILERTEYWEGSNDVGLLMEASDKALFPFSIGQSVNRSCSPSPSPSCRLQPRLTVTVTVRRTEDGPP